eukprot:Blabericola_migrator_1__9593@NODE_5232_length_834_cov_940_271186_g3339_i0_p1_GENE_NODE_5232_length_834_cov_940_271186_g3339_i0NODE_5232_length_834_cov_940_271186_g3339_i0_p1_ORF_typecomplete_len204_score30_36CFEM/PF05730_11/9_5e02CFEM/PF05730_11/1_9_NODE_5232_length_834_cov_940_271186_g3339_i0112723
MVAFSRFIAFLALTASAQNIIEEGTNIDDCGESCTDLIGGSLDLSTLVSCIATLKERPSCKITYSAPAVVVVKETCENDETAVKITVTGVADWILGSESGSILTVASQFPEGSTRCVVQVFEGSNCDSTDERGTLTLEASSTSEVTLLGADAVIKADDVACLADLDTKIAGSTVIVVIGESSGAASALSLSAAALALTYVALH